MTLELDGVRRTFAGGVAALRGISARLPGDAYSCIMGASGSGKTTLLRIIAGLERADAGRVLLAGTPIDARPPEQRPIHTVAQDGALFPHLDALANVGFAPRLRGLRGRELEARATASLEAVGLVDPALYRRRPHALSGGERQRVALARALAGDPEVILLDEPLAALDRPLRAALRRTLRDTRRARRLCFVHVTHDPEEALALADHLLVLADGAAIAEGPPAQLYARPPNLAAARLLGGLSPIPGSKPRWIRPERLRVAVDGSGVDGEVVDASLLGGRWELLVRAGPVTLTAQSAAAAPIGARVRVSWDPGDELDFSGELGEADG